jgi:CBS domain-containing protein
MAEVLELLQQARLKCAPVVSNGELVGIISFD